MSLPSNRNDSISVNNFNGNLVFTQPVTHNDSGNLMPVNILLVYNSNGYSVHYRSLKKSFQTNYHIFVRYNSCTPTKFRITDKNKNKIYFDKSWNIIRLINVNGVSSNIQYKVIVSTNLYIEAMTDGL